MMGRAVRISLLIIAAIIGIASAVASQRGEGDRRAKARYFYLKGAISEAEGNIDQAYEYYKKAHRVDPEYPDASFAYGFNRIIVAADTFGSPEEIRRNLTLMRVLIDAYPGDVEASERYAYMAVMADTLPEALRVYNKLVASNPGLSRLYYPLAYYHYNAGHVDSAVYAIREYERLEGATPETTIRKISYFLSDGDTLSALRESALFVESYPKLPEAYTNKAMVYSVLGRPDSAIMFLEEALNIFPNNSEMKFDIALLYAERGDSAKFHTLTAEAFEGDEMEYEDRMSLLNIYMRNLPTRGSDDEYKESDKIFKRAAELYPEDADFFDTYAEYELMKGNYKAALEREKRALALNPTEPTFLGRTISFSVIADSPKEGMAAFENFPDPEARRNFRLLLSMVTAAQLAKDYETALQWADTIINVSIPGLELRTRLTPEMADSLTAIYDDATLESVGVAYEVAGDLYARIKKKEEAVDAYENALLLIPEDKALVSNNFAWFIVETLKADPGTELFEKAKQLSWNSLEMTADNPSSTYLDTYAWILFKEGNYKEALDYQELAMDSEGEEASAELYSHYGDILFMNGRPAEALEQWTKALELEPDDELLKKKVEHKTFFYE